MGDGDLVRADYHLERTRFEAAIPLLSRGGQTGSIRVIGVLDLQKVNADPLDEQEVSILTTIADQIASGITSIRAMEETRQALQDLEQLRQRYVGESWDRLAPSLQAAGYRWSGGGTLPLEHRLLPEAEQVVSFQRPLMEEGKLIVPISYAETKGIEDARFVRFTDEDGSVTFYATYRAVGVNVLGSSVH